MVHIKKSTPRDGGGLETEWRYTGGVGYVDADEVVIWVEVDTTQVENKFRYEKKDSTRTEQFNGEWSPQGTIQLEETVDASLQVIARRGRANTADRIASVEVVERCTS
jgi:hypothetical protein